MWPSALPTRETVGGCRHDAPMRSGAVGVELAVSTGDSPVSNSTFPLWSDEPAVQDLLAFDAVADTVLDAIFDDDLDPVAVGLSGAWGSGKTSVLNLVEAGVKARSRPDKKIVVVATQPWGYDPSVGPKATLITEVLFALEAEIKDSEGSGAKAKELLGKLAKKVDWAKALKMAATTGITLQLPKPEDLLDLVKQGGSKGKAGDDDREMGNFRKEFGGLLKDDALEHVARLVVLVDDLDRCLPDSVIETLEAIRLFLSVKGMSFVIAADEDRVADALQQKLKATTPQAAAEEESPAKLYLHKIVQTTVPLPGLSRFDTQAYLLLLLIRSKLDVTAFSGVVRSCDELRRTAQSLDLLDLPAGIDLNDELATASRLTPILYEKFRGNPRRIKRFLNDLNVRQAVARRRGIELPSAAVAKLMVLERLLSDDFTKVLEWLASNTLRDRLQALDSLANSPVTVPSDDDPEADVQPPKDGAGDSVTTESFSDTLVRWAKLPPSLDSGAVSSYLYLAASFARVEVVNEGLPERLRDLAASLSSSLKLDRAGVNDASLQALSDDDAQLLISHLGRQTRDQPSLQKFSVDAMLRVASVHPGSDSKVVDGLLGIPVSEVDPVVALKLRTLDAATFGKVLTHWEAGGADEMLLRTIGVVRDAWGDPNGN